MYFNKIHYIMLPLIMIFCALAGWFTFRYVKTVGAQTLCLPKYLKCEVVSNDSGPASCQDGNLWENDNRTYVFGGGCNPNPSRKLDDLIPSGDLKQFDCTPRGTQYAVCCRSSFTE